MATVLIIGVLLLAGYGEEVKPNPQEITANTFQSKSYSFQFEPGQNMKSFHSETLFFNSIWLRCFQVAYFYNDFVSEYAGTILAKYLMPCIGTDGKMGTKE